METGLSVQDEFEYKTDSSMESHSESDRDVPAPVYKTPLERIKGYLFSLFDNFSPGPFFATVAFFLVCLYVNSVVQVFTEKRADPTKYPTEGQDFNNTTQPIALSDLGFDVFPYLKGRRELADLFVVIACVLSFVRFMPTYIRWAFLRRFLFFYGIV
jgi:hypothetical protein